VLATAGPSVTWYLTRSSGAVTLVLLTLAVALGVLDVTRLRGERWPRFVLDALHRNAALLAVCFLAVHVLTAVADGFTSIGLRDAIVPFAGSYRPFWLGLGALACDLMVAVALTSLVRRRLGYRAWRAVHWASYASWPIALLHGLGTGSDTKETWMLALAGICLSLVLGAVAVRLGGSWRARPDLARAAAGVAAVFVLFLGLWLPAGPLGREWARRSGTPAALLHHASPRVHRAGGSHALAR
jgi:methionine sulfoxide reductase heme-binding subunit